MQKVLYIIDDTLNNENWTYSYILPLIDFKGDTIKERNGWMCSLKWRAIEKKNLHVCKDGYWEFYHENRQLMKVVKHTDSSALLMQAFYKDGTQKEIDGKGEFKEPYSNDPLESFQGSYSDGILNGRYIKYFENGKIEKEGQYKNGKAEGEWIHYYFYYGKSFIRNYRNGEAHGYFYNFYINGGTTRIRFFRNGLESGVT